MKTVSIEDAKEQLDQLIDDVNAGEEIIIADQSGRVAKISGVNPEQLPPGHPVRIAAWLRNNPFPEEFRRTREEILRDLEEERNAWD